MDRNTLIGKEEVVATDVEAKAAERQRIASQVDEFLSKGGKIQQCSDDSNLPELVYGRSDFYVVSKKNKRLGLVFSDKSCMAKKCDK